MRDFFGWGTEGEETPLETVIRELSEEISCEVSNINFLLSCEVEHVLDGQKYHIIWHFFSWTIEESNLDKIEFYEGKKLWFFSLHDIATMQNIVPRVRDLIQYAEDQYSK